MNTTYFPIHVHRYAPGTIKYELKLYIYLLFLSLWFLLFWVFELLCRVSEIKNFILCWNVLFCLIITVSCVYVHYILYFDIIIQFCKKAIFFSYYFFSLELRLPITTNLVYVLKINYILEKSLPVEVMGQIQALSIFLSGNILLLYMSY